MKLVQTNLHSTIFILIPKQKEALKLVDKLFTFYYIYINTSC